MGGFFVPSYIREVVTMASVDMVDKIKRPPGRPELYPTLVQPRLDEIYEWISQGCTEQSICKALGIHRDTWIRYKDSNIELTDTITRARGAAGELLLNKQFAAACGQRVTLNKQKVTKDGDILDITEDIYVAPNVNAADFWSRHMMPGYIAPRSSDSGQNITVNFQLPEAREKVEQLLTEREKLRAVDITGLEVVEVD